MRLFISFYRVFPHFIIFSLLFVCAANAQMGELDEISVFSSLYDSWNEIRDVEHYDNYSYLLEYGSRVIILDIQDLQQEAVEIGHIDIPELFYIKVHDNFLYALDRQTIYTYSLSDPSSPTLVYTTPVDHLYDTISRAYFAENFEKFYFFSSHGYVDPRGDPYCSYVTIAYDISANGCPVYNTHDGDSAFSFISYSYFSDQDYLYIIDRTYDFYNFFSVSIRDPETLEYISSFSLDFPLPSSTFMYDPFKSGNYIFFPTSLYLFALDMTDSSNPEWVTIEEGNQTFCESTNIVFNDNLCSFGDGVLKIFDLSSFPQVSLIAGYNFPELSGGINVIDINENIFSAPAIIELPENNSAFGMLIFRLTDDDNYEVLNSVYSTGVSFISSCKNGNSLFLFDSSDSLRVVNISDDNLLSQSDVISVQSIEDVYPPPLLRANENVVVLQAEDLIQIFRRTGENQLEYVTYIDFQDINWNEFNMTLNENILIAAGSEWISNELYVYTYDLKHPDFPFLIDSDSRPLSRIIQCIDFDENYTVHAISSNDSLYRFDCSVPEYIQSLETTYFEIPQFCHLTDIDIKDETINYSYYHTDDYLPLIYGININGNYFTFDSNPNLALVNQGNYYFHGNRNEINIYHIEDQNNVTLLDNCDMSNLIWGGLHPHGEVFIAVTERTVRILHSDQMRVDPEPEPLPQTFEILSVYPNPFNSSISTKFNLPENSDVVIKITNLLGQELYSIKQNYNAGTNYWHWNSKSNSGVDVASGIYFLNINTGNQQQSRKIILLK